MVSQNGAMIVQRAVGMTPPIADPALTRIQTVRVLAGIPTALNLAAPPMATGPVLTATTANPARRNANHSTDPTAPPGDHRIAVRGILIPIRAPALTAPTTDARIATAAHRVSSVGRATAPILTAITVRATTNRVSIATALNLIDLPMATDPASTATTVSPDQEVRIGQIVRFGQTINPVLSGTTALLSGQTVGKVARPALQMTAVATGQTVRNVPVLTGMTARAMADQAGHPVLTGVMHPAIKTGLTAPANPVHRVFRAMISQDLSA